VSSKPFPFYIDTHTISQKVKALDNQKDERKVTTLIAFTQAAIANT